MPTHLVCIKGMTTQRLHLVAGCVVIAASGGAGAVGFGRVSPSAVLGQPLQVTVPLRLESGERLFAECVRAEVTAGDTPLNPQQVRVSVQPGSTPQDWLAHISTTVPVEEPVVEVAVSAGCEKRFMRRFTAFADPPEMAARVAPPAPVVAPMVVATASDRAEARRGASEPNLPVRRADGRRPASTDPVPPAQPQRPARPPRPVVAKAAAPSAAPVGAAPAGVASKHGAEVARAPLGEAQMARLLLDVGGPRLKLDIDEPLMSAPAGVVAAASLPPLEGSAGEADLARLQALEKSLKQLRKDNQNAQGDMKARLAEAESRSRLLPWLLGLLLLVGGLAAWLAWRLRQQPRAAEADSQQWWSSQAAPLSDLGAEQPSAADAAPSVAGELVDDLGPTPAAAVAPVARSWVEEPSEAETALQRTAAMPAPAVGFASLSGGALDASPAREVSVEELLDLEQQADFFIALGQEDAAVDLLMSHLRSTGGLSPLPYTKLLEIYKRQGDRGAYERIRARFNRRFNAYAPDWDVGPMQGRALEDYPDVIQYLQSLWSSPLDAMAVLEGMLFRKDEGQDMFDLPAYKDVLLLYSLARDLWQQGGPALTDVDVLLPLGEGAVVPALSAGLGAAALDQGASSSDPDHPSYDLTAFELEPRSNDGPSAPAFDWGLSSLPGPAPDASREPAPSWSGDASELPPLDELPRDPPPKGRH